MESLAIRTTTAAAVAANELHVNVFNEYISDIVKAFKADSKTTRSYIVNLRQFAAWLRYNTITRPISNDISSYREYLEHEHEAIQLDSDSVNGWKYRTDASGSRIIVTCKASTVKQYLQTVKMFFKWTSNNGIYPNIAADVRSPRVRQDAHKKEALTASDVLAIEKSIVIGADVKTAAAAACKKDTAGRIDRATEQGKRLYAMYLLAVNCGLRTIEISRANIKDIETMHGISFLYVWGKGHSEADAKKTLAPEVKAAIDDYLSIRTDAKTGNSPLFVSTGNRSGGKRIAATTISTMLKKAMQRAGYDSERITAHSLRHTAGTNVQELTGNIYLTQQYMRHANPATTEIYLHNETEKQESEIAQRLYNFYHGITDTADTKKQLENIVATLTPEQLRQLTGVAAAMAR